MSKIITKRNKEIIKRSKNQKNGSSSKYLNLENEKWIVTSYKKGHIYKKCKKCKTVIACTIEKFDTNCKKCQGIELRSKTGKIYGDYIVSTGFTKQNLFYYKIHCTKCNEEREIQARHIYHLLLCKKCYLKETIDKLKELHLNRKIGDFTVIDLLRTNRKIKKEYIYVILICDKGHKKTCRLDDYRRGINNKQDFICKNPICQYSKEIGKTYNLLTILEIVDKSDNRVEGLKGRRVRALVRCNCGKEKIMSISKIKTGTIRSCGCTALSSVKVDILGIKYESISAAARSLMVCRGTIRNIIINPNNAQQILNNYKPQYPDIPEPFRKGIHKLVQKTVNIFTSNKAAKYDSIGKTNTKMVFLDEISHFTTKPLAGFGMFHDGSELNFINDNFGLSVVDASLTFEKKRKHRQTMYGMWQALKRLGFKVDFKTEDINNYLIGVKEEKPYQYVHLDYEGALTNTALAAIESSIEYFSCIMVTVQEYASLANRRNETRPKKDGSEIYARFDPKYFPSTKCKQIHAMQYKGLRQASMWSYILTAH